MTSVAVHPDWFEHPLVLHAADEHPDDAAGMLCRLSEMLGMLEGMFPGKKFADIMAISDMDRTLAVRSMTRAGILPEDIASALGLDSIKGLAHHTFTLSERRMWLMEVADDGRPPAVQYAAADPDTRPALREFRIGTALRNKLTPTQREWLELHDQHGRGGAIERRNGWGGEQIDMSLLRRHYHQTRKLHDYSEAS